MRSLVTHIDKLKKNRFSKLILRQILPSFSLGNISVIHEYILPNTKLPAVRHNSTTELVYCVRGRVTAILGKRRYSIRKGHIIWIPPKIRHAFVTKTDAAEAISIFYPTLDLDKKPAVQIQD